MEDRIYLTFDDGPDTQWTPQILDLLAEAGMQATFFAIGQQAQLEPIESGRPIYWTPIPEGPIT